MMWERAALDAIAEGTWRSPATTTTERSKILNNRPSPLSMRADNWNTYCISTIPTCARSRPCPRTRPPPT
eukprot:7007832-Lingulodinium_polyedra.AAC.1